MIKMSPPPGQRPIDGGGESIAVLVGKDLELSIARYPYRRKQSLISRILHNRSKVDAMKPVYFLETIWTRDIVDLRLGNHPAFVVSRRISLRVAVRKAATP